MKISEIGKRFEGFGYDINLLQSLVFIPCTLQGACYLGVQPHRGNHGEIVGEDNYDDDSEPLSYHKFVATKIQDLELPFSKECLGDDIKKREAIRKSLDGLSKKILGIIQKNPAWRC